nr:MAG TPA: hypothetical protein [Bacteriophage sp.]
MVSPHFFKFFLKPIDFFAFMTYNISRGCISAQNERFIK